MPARPTVSPLEAIIIPVIKARLESGTGEEILKTESTPEDGSKILIDAISAGINEAFKSPIMQGMMAAILDTNSAAVIPIGKTAYSTIMTPATTPTVPNPLLA